MGEPEAKRKGNATCSQTSAAGTDKVLNMLEKIDTKVEISQQRALELNINEITLMVELNSV